MGVFCLCFGPILISSGMRDFFFIFSMALCLRCYVLLSGSRIVMRLVGSRITIKTLLTGIKKDY